MHGDDAQAVLICNKVFGNDTMPPFHGCLCMNHSFIMKLLITLFVIITSSFIVLIQNKSMGILGLISLTYGLRHGLDADHILAIDNITRKFQADNQGSETTGIFFALGHSTIVFLLTVGIVLGVTHLHEHSSQLQKIGVVVGSIISTLFLWLSAYMNIFSLLSFRNNQNKAMVGNRLFRYINKPYKMYWVGLLFGLGFDTATEVGLLSIAATSALAGFQLGMVLLLPVLFASGMVFVDSIDAMCMSSLYRMTARRNDSFHFYYKIMIFMTAVLSFVVGWTELMSIINVQYQSAEMIALVDGINDYSEVIGGMVLLLFIVSLSYIKSRLQPLPKMDV